MFTPLTKSRQPFMKRCFFNWLLAVACLTSAPRTFGESTFAGVLLSGRGEGFVAGNVRLTVQGGSVRFQSTLFSSVAAGAGLEAVLMSQNKSLPLAYTNGVASQFELWEFFGSIPGWDNTPPCGWEFTVVDPGWAMPWYFDGVRFTGSFTAFPGLENLLSAKSGEVRLQMRGNFAGMLEDPVFTALLVEEHPQRAAQFGAEVAAPTATGAGTSPLRLEATFSLSGNCLYYTLIWDASAAWAAVGIVGRTGPHTRRTDLVADLSTPQRIAFTAGPDQPTMVLYLGAVSLTDEAVKQLKLGKLSLRVITSPPPALELWGRISPVTKADGRLNPK